MSVKHQIGQLLNLDCTKLQLNTNQRFMKGFFNFSLKRLEWNIFRSLVTRQSMWKWQVFKQTVDNSECRCGKQLIWRNSSCLLQLRRDLLLTLCSATLPRAILYAQPSVWPATLSCLLLLGQPSLPPGQHHNTTHSDTANCPLNYCTVARVKKRAVP